MANNTYKRDMGNAPRAKNVPRGTNEPMGKPAAKNARKDKATSSLPKLNFSFLNFFFDRRFQLFVGFFFLLGSLYLMIAFLSHLFTGDADQSMVEGLTSTGFKEAGMEAENWLGLVGAWISHFIILEGFGIASFFVVPIFFFLGNKIVFRSRNISLSYVLALCLFSLWWFSLMFGYLVVNTSSGEPSNYLSGAIGYETAWWLDNLIAWGTIPL